MTDTNYLTTQGKVLSSEVGVGQSISTTVSGQSSSLKEMYYPDVCYEYTVNGITYENDRFWIDPKIQTNQRQSIELILTQFPVGKTITVYYHPNSPQESYLENLPDVNFRRMMLLGIGVTLAIVAVVVVAIVLAS